MGIKKKNLCENGDFFAANLLKKFILIREEIKWDIYHWHFSGLLIHKFYKKMKKRFKITRDIYITSIKLS